MSKPTISEAFIASLCFPIGLTVLITLIDSSEAAIRMLPVSFGLLVMGLAIVALRSIGAFVLRDERRRHAYLTARRWWKTTTSTVGWLLLVLFLIVLCIQVTTS